MHPSGTRPACVKWLFRPYHRVMVPTRHPMQAPWCTQRTHTSHRVFPKHPMQAPWCHQSTPYRLHVDPITPCASPRVSTKHPTQVPCFPWCSQSTPCRPPQRPNIATTTTHHCQHHIRPTPTKSWRFGPLGGFIAHRFGLASLARRKYCSPFQARFVRPS